MSKLTIEQIKAELQGVSQSKFAKRTDKQLERDDALRYNRTFTAEGRDKISKTHTGKGKSKLATIRAQETYDKRKAIKYDINRLMELAKSCKSITEFEEKYPSEIAYARKQPWYPQMYEMLGGTTKWDKDKAVNYLKQFESRAAAWLDKQGQQAILWLHRNGLNHLQSKIWADFKAGKGVTINKKLTEKQLIGKINQIAKKYNTISYSKIISILRSEGFGAADHKVKSIVQSKSFKFHK